MTHRYVNPDPSFMAGPDGTIEMHWYEPVSSERAVEVIFDPWAALAFLRNLATHVSYALDNALDTAVIGSCDRCKNSRMVEGHRGNRTELVHCPDCKYRVNHLRELYAESAVDMRDTGEALK